MKNFMAVTRKHTLDWYFSWILASFVFFRPLRTVFLYFERTYLHTERLFSFISIFVYFFILIFPLVFQIKRIKGKVSYLLLIIFFIVDSLLASYSNLEYLNSFISEGIFVLTRALPFYIVTLNIEDFSELEKILFKSSAFTIFSFSLMLLFGLLNGNLFEDGERYNQFYGIILAPSVVLSFIALCETHRNKYLYILMLGIVNLVIYGARSPLACLLLAMGLKFFTFRTRKSKNIKKSTLQTIIVLFLLAALLLIYIIEISSNVYTTVLPGQRILYQISNGEFFKSSGRMDIFKSFFKVVHPITGYGFLSDRIALARISGSSSFLGQYVHNIFLEFLLQYGLFTGTLINIVFVWSSFYLLIKFKTNVALQNVYIFIVSCMYGILLFSDTAMKFAPFWMYVAMVVRFLLNKKIKSFFKYRIGVNNEK